MTRDDVRRTLIAYDIPDDRRRLQVSQALQRFGDRVQYSVFVVDCSPARLLVLEARLARLLHPEADSLLFCDLGLRRSLTATSFRYVGRTRPLTGDDDLIV